MNISSSSSSSSDEDAIKTTNQQFEQNNGGVQDQPANGSIGTTKMDTTIDLNNRASSSSSSTGRPPEEDEGEDDVDDDIMHHYEREVRKNSELQLYLVNSIREVCQMEIQLEEYRKEIRTTSRERDELRLELNRVKRKAGWNGGSSTHDEVASSSSSSSSASKKLKTACMQTKISSQPILVQPKVEQLLKKIQPMLIQADAHAPLKSFCNKFVVRIFDANLYYGLINEYTKQNFHVVYSDGDHQRLSINEVLSSLVNESKVPIDVKEKCRLYVRSGSYKSRQELGPPSAVLK